MTKIDPEFESLVSKYSDIEAIILSKVEKLSEYGKDCECDEPERFKFVDRNNVIVYCLRCGGNIDW